MFKTTKCEDYAFMTPNETLQKGFGGGVTHRIGSIRPRHGTQLSWRSEIKFLNISTYTSYVYPR